MQRKIKALGLVALVVLAIGAIGASGARAEVDDAQLTLEESPAVIVGAQTEQHVLTRTGRTVTCETVEFEGEVTNGATTITLVPYYAECHSLVLGNVLPATVTTNECYYLWHLKRRTDPTEYAADTDLICAKESAQIEIHIYNSHTNHTEGNASCEYTYPQQYGLEGVDLTNSEGEPDYLVADMSISGIQSHAHGSPLLCGSTEDATGGITGTTTLKAEAEAEGVGATISADESQTTHTTNGKFTTAEYPAVIVGEQTEALVFKRQGREVTCETTDFVTTVSEAGVTATLVPTFEECHAIVLGSQFPATVIAGCGYTLHGTAHYEEEAHSYSAEASLSCVYVIRVYQNHTKHTEGIPSCVYTIAEQKGLEGIGLTNVAASPDYVVADVNVEGISSTASGTSTLLCGSASDENGTLQGTATFAAETVGGEPIGLTVSTDESE